MISWKKYIDKTSSRPPRDLLVAAVSYVISKGNALDLGAGAHMDSKYLLQEGFQHVTAVDADPAAEEKAQDITEENFSFVKSRFEDFDFQKESYDLINAQRALPYINPEKFDAVMEKIKASLKPGGVFVGQVFGDKDENIISGHELIHLTEEETQKLFSDMEILKFEETHEDKESTLGTTKHFHEFEIIARKKVSLHQEY